jgi:GNAT superfamily N-acetyltransferase
MTRDVQLKQFELPDQDALLSFLRVAYAVEPRKADPAFWRWQYLENPYTSLDDLPLWIAKDGERVVGQAAAIPVEIKVGEEKRPASWILDFILSAEYRGLGLGKKLLRAAAESCPTLLALGLNDASINTAARVGWKRMENIHRYHRMLFPGGALKETAGLGPIRELLNLCYAPFRPRLSGSAAADGIALRQITSFDAAFDDLWQRASKQWPCAVRRKASYLEWQFMRQPGKLYDALGLYDQDQLLGYVVLYFRKPERGGAPLKAAISDICYDAGSFPEIVDELLKAALRLALERRAGSLVTDVLDSRVEERLGHFGFRRIRRSPPFMVHSPDRQELLYETANWFLTRADSDVSIFEEPNKEQG